MAPRANWKGFLRLSLVTCPVALFPATSESEKVSFNQINRKTGNRIRYLKVDAETGDEVEAADIMKGYKVDTDQYIEVTPDEIEAILPESGHTIEIDQFVPKQEIDDLYLMRPYYIVPDGKVGHDAYAVIRDTIKAMDKVALARLVLTNREHVIALQPRGKGLVGILLRYPYEVRDEHDYFDDIQDVKVTREMLDLARHIVESKSAHFAPEDFKDEYESALIDLINRKNAGQPMPKAKPRQEGNVISLMDALRRSLGKGDDASSAVKADAPAGKKKAPAKGRKTSRKRVEGQREMLLPISGKGAAREASSAKAPVSKTPARKASAKSGRQRKAG